MVYNIIWPKTGRGDGDMERGLWRDGHFVQVSYDDVETLPISRALYEQRGYQPPFYELPTRQEYDAGSQ